MANERGHYGPNGAPRVGQAPTVYVEHKTSIGTWILGGLAIGGALLYARHQARQIEQLYQTAGLPQQSFAGSLGESARALPTRAKATLQGLAERVRSKKVEPPKRESTGKAKIEAKRSDEP